MPQDIARGACDIRQSEYTTYFGQFVLIVFFKLTNIVPIPFNMRWLQYRRVH